MKTSVELDCGNGVTFLRSCYESNSQVDMCKVTVLENKNETAVCKVSWVAKTPHNNINNTNIMYTYKLSIWLGIG